MRCQIQESADALSDAETCMRETHEGPSQTCGGYLLTPIAATTHLRRLRLGDLSVLGARMVLRPSAGEGLSTILAPNTPALLDTRKKWDRPPQPYQRASAEQPDPQTPRPNPRVSVGRRSLQCGSRRRCRYPEPNRFAIWRAPLGDPFPRTAKRARKRSPSGGRHHVHRYLRASERASERAAGVSVSACGGRGRRTGSTGGRA